METTPEPRTVAALLFPGFELLDVFGPLELFGITEGKFRLLTVGLEAGPVASAQGPQAIVDVELLRMPAVDVLLVPGGQGTRALVKSSEFLSLIGRAAEHATIVASVCTGSAVLAAAGLLDGMGATSNKEAFEFAVAQSSRVKWQRKARWVEDGRFFTSSGVSAGMDMALALIAHLCGRDTALATARAAEYSWNEDSSADPFAI